ncbi:MAG: S9 family peptidase [Acidobacteria bacterium]|nr:S9 family peptidase [Acidobacteriota bacterium]MBI3280817.1 S9 family peptidase [Acidobacteriota bacterium]
MPRALAVPFCLAVALAQAPPPAPLPSAAPPSAVAAQAGRSDRHRNDQLAKAIDDLQWRLALGDLAAVDKVRYTSLPPAKQPNPTAQGAGNPVIIPAYTFIPRKLDRSKKHPLIVFTHGGVHSNFASGSYVHIVRELLEQGYVVLAPEYRGSTGYGAGFYDLIDYGGREIDDVLEGRRWMIEQYSFLDPGRVGAIGWSHGGLISLLMIFRQPEAFAAAYAGVPVSDLVARMGYKSGAYRAIFSARGHIGKTAEEDVQEYLRRSPVSHVRNLATPLLIHTNTNDEDVNVLEVQRLIAALKAEGKKFEYRIYQNAPGGHAFNRIDTKLARESRAEIYAFLAQYLKPGQ